MPTDGSLGSFPEPSRDVPVAGRPGVLVVGGGCAGVAAAVAAARRGADTWLLEATGSLGGLATVGLINLLLTMDDGAGTPVVAGLCQEFVDRLTGVGQAVYPSPAEWNREEQDAVNAWRPWGLIWGAPESVRYSVAFDPEAFVDISIEALAQAGCRLKLYTWFAGVAMAGQGRAIEAVFVESKRGREAILPRVVVDATGDADVAVAADAACESVTIPPHLWFRAGGVDSDVVDGTLAHGFAFRTTGRGRVLVPWGPDSERVDACDPDDMTRATLACRGRARQAFERLRHDDPAFAGAWLDDYARLLGITESRRLVGDYVLAKDDGDVRFADSVAQTGHWTRRHVVFDIPYRCLKTAAVDNLLVAGRCISTTRYVHQATKEIPAAMATGEAAGAAAAMAAGAAAAMAAGLARPSVHDVDVDALRADLRRAGAFVGGDAVGARPM